MKDFENVFRYNLLNGNSINLILHNKLIENYAKLDIIFIRLVFKYVSVNHIHLFSEELIDLGFGIKNYRNLADKLCFIDMSMVNSYFRYYNVMFGKTNMENDGNFVERYNKKSMSCLKYMNYKIIVDYFKDRDDVMYDILLKLYDAYKHKLIIKYMVYYSLSDVKNEDYDMEKKLVNIDSTPNIITVQNLFSDFDQKKFGYYTKNKHYD